MRTVRELKHTCNTFFLHAFQPSRQKQTAFFHILTFFCCHALRSCIHRNMFPLAAPVSRCYKPLPPPHHHPHPRHPAKSESLFVSLHFFVFMLCVVLRQSPELRWKGGEEEKEDLQQPPAKSCKHTNRPQCQSDAATRTSTLLMEPELRTAEREKPVGEAELPAGGTTGNREENLRRSDSNV